MTLKEKHTMMTNLGKKAILYCDMDGVIAKWRDGCTKEDTLVPGYFYNLEIEEGVKEALTLLHEAGFKICFLSAAYMNGVAEVEKANWIKKHNIDFIDKLFVPVGRNKADFIEIVDGVNYFLLDDYNFNLNNWAQLDRPNNKFIAIKFLNGINGGSNEWNGRTIYHRSSGEMLAHTLADFMVMA